MGDIEECERLYFRLNNEGTNSENYLILKGKTNQKAGAIISGTSSLALTVPRYASLLKRPINQRKIDLHKCDKSGLWYMGLIPDYEYKVHDLNNPPKEKVIYKIIFNGHIQNIGETNNLKHNDSFQTLRRRATDKQLDVNIVQPNGAANKS